jgi:REP element-mobilizing transposase RayT
MARAVAFHDGQLLLPPATVANRQTPRSFFENSVLGILEQTRRKYHFVVHGYVLMPEHFHLLITEPETGDPSVVMKVLKHAFASGQRTYILVNLKT